MQTPWSVRTVVCHDEAEWFKQNIHRQRRAFSRLEGDLLFAGEHPLRFAASLLSLQIAVLVLFAVLPQEWFATIWLNWSEAEQLTHFSTVWTIQATLAALVYPIVISFVAVYLQRRPAAEAFIHLYMLDSGGLAAGLSSLTLVIVMGVQYLMLSTWGTLWLPGWATIDTAWFVINASLTTLFLFRTVEFLRPEVQDRVIQRYTVNVALPRDIQRLNSFQVLAGGIAKGWFRVPSYGDDKAPAGPRLLISRFAFGEGAVQSELNLRAQARLVDVRLWLVRIVVNSWYRKALILDQPEKPKAFGINNSFPLLTLPMIPGQVYEGKLPLARVADGPPLARWQRLLLNWSVVIHPISRERYGIRVEAILGELASDVRNMAAKPDNEGFDRAYNTLTDLHKLLLAACLDKTESGEQGSWALLYDNESFFERPIHINWSNVYRGIFEASIEAMVRDVRPLRRLCNLIMRLDGEELRASPVGIREDLLDMPPLMMYQLSNWWTSRIEEQGVVDHSHRLMVLLRPPLSRVYEDVLAAFVGGWENCRPAKLYSYRNARSANWETLQGLVRLDVKHIEETSRMLLAAIFRGDQAAATWLADALSKWWDNLGSNDFSYLLFDKSAFITVNDLRKPWIDFCNDFGVDIDLSDSVIQISPTLQYEVYCVAIKNYWTDIRLLCIELMLDWIRSEPASTVESSLAFEIAVGLLNGKQWKSGGNIDNSLKNINPSNYVEAKVRQFASSGNWRTGYIAQLDRFVEKVKDMRRPNMIGSRIYSYSGADNVESLQQSQMELLSIMTNDLWIVPNSLDRQLDLWFDGNSSRVNSIRIIEERVKNWIKHLEVKSNLSVDHIDILKKHVRHGVSVELAIDNVKASLLKFEASILARRDDLLAAKQIDPSRLEEICRFASTTGFSKEVGLFPVHLFEIFKTDEDLEDFTIKFNQIRRGELIDLELDQRAVNESEFYSEAIAHHVANVVLGDLLARSIIKEILVKDAESYWRALQLESSRIAETGGEPILILDNATRPDWVWDWQNGDFSSEYKRPDNLQVKRLDVHASGYLCNFNDIAVYVAPLSPGQSILLSNKIFRTLKFREYKEGQFVKPKVVELADLKNLVDLELTFSRHIEVEKSTLIRLRYD